ncbi:hypothetical protein [Dysosmobacter sp.]|uniref:hypothetical protein n=1 Tax=Dysosmobacter sp. TaxID=2591382 RepID=UPI003A2E4E0C
MQPGIWICIRRPDKKVLQTSAAACMPQIEHEILAALRARGLLTDTEYRRCSALLIRSLP